MFAPSRSLFYDIAMKIADKDSAGDFPVAASYQGVTERISEAKTAGLPVIVPNRPEPPGSREELWSHLTENEVQARIVTSVAKMNFHNIPTVFLDARNFGNLVDAITNFLDTHGGESLPNASLAIYNAVFETKELDVGETTFNFLKSIRELGNVFVVCCINSVDYGPMFMMGRRAGLAVDEEFERHMILLAEIGSQSADREKVRIDVEHYFSVFSFIISDGLDLELNAFEFNMSPSAPAPRPGDGTLMELWGRWGVVVPRLMDSITVNGFGLHSDIFLAQSIRFPMIQQGHSVGLEEAVWSIEGIGESVPWVEAEEKKIKEAKK